MIIKLKGYYIGLETYYNLKINTSDKNINVIKNSENLKSQILKIVAQLKCPEILRNQSREGMGYIE